MEPWMVGSIIGILIGAGAILLGLKGFSPDGLPFTKTKRITGGPAKIIGVICILFGLACIAANVYPFVRGQ